MATATCWAGLSLREIMSDKEQWTVSCGLGQRPDGVQTVLTTDTQSSETKPKAVEACKYVEQLL